MPTDTMLVQFALVLTCLVTVEAQFHFCPMNIGTACYPSTSVCPEDTVKRYPDIDHDLICPIGSVCCQGTPSKCYIQNQANCVNGTCDPNTSACVCNQGYIGPLCDNDVCLPNPCNGGTCASDGIGGYTCTCVAPGTKGTNCEINACDVNQCTSAGTAQCVPVTPTTQNKDNPYTCTCNDGYYNTFCQTNYCDEGSCGPNSNACVGLAVAPFYQCTCNIGFSGPKCNIDICESKCYNHGTCTRGDGVYTCECNPDYKGVDCDVPVTYTCGISTPTQRLLGGMSGTGKAKSTARVLLFNVTIGTSVFVQHAANQYKSVHMVFTTAEVCAICDTAGGGAKCMVRFGDDDLTLDEAEQDIAVSEIVFHGAFMNKSSIADYINMDTEDLKRNGICALKLANKIVPTGAVAPVCGYNNEAYSDCYVSGYGITNETEVSATNKNVLAVELVSSQCVCAKLRGKVVANMAPTIRCAVTCDAPETKGACFHDYGGPVYCKGVDSGTFSLKGWVTMDSPYSKIARCETGTIIWTDAADFTAWIDSTFETVP